MQCLQQISLKYYDKDIAIYGTDYVRLNQWWASLQAQWAKTSAEKEELRAGDYKTSAFRTLDRAGL